MCLSLSGDSTGPSVKAHMQTHSLPLIRSPPHGCHGRRASVALSLGAHLERRAGVCVGGCLSCLACVRRVCVWGPAVSEQAACSCSGRVLVDGATRGLGCRVCRPRVSGLMGRGGGVVGEFCAREMLGVNRMAHPSSCEDAGAAGRRGARRAAPRERAVWTRARAYKRLRKRKNSA